MTKKRILFIYPSSYDSKNRLIKSKKSFIPSRTLPYLAALTPKRYEVRIVDELVDDLNFDQDVDLIVLTGMLFHMPRAIDIAREFKRHGIPSIIGGVGAFAIQDKIEKSGAFDSLVIGEVDVSWGGILEDFDRGELKKCYECTASPELKALPIARFDLINRKKYMRYFSDRRSPIIPIETSRGCPHNCNFCLVTRYFGKKMRYRPVEEVVEEIKYHGAKFILFTDDNIAINRTRAQKLFLAIKPLNIQWLGQFESSVIKHPELLRLASESGCRTAFVGVESIFSDNLHSVNKSHSANIDFKDITKGFKEVGIDLFPSLIFGMDHDTQDLIKQTIEQMIKSNVDAIIPWIFTPTPGTPSYDKYKTEKRLVHENYSSYDYWHVVAQPRQMTQGELDRAFWQGLKHFYSLRSIFQRAWRGRQWNMTWFLCSMYFRHQVCKKLHPFAGRS